ncbi:MAG: hypothetical protein KGL38_11735, partial [Gemmatimonadota bacterium]|nr:hypothetical protein [Gemmatimonadota bacterium]
MSDPRLVTNAPGGSPLSRAARSGALDAAVFAAPPRSVDGWRARARAVAAGAPADWLGALRGAIG